jgi:hypothetical protein
MVVDAAGSLRADANAVERWGGRVPILLGACGHRDIEESDKLAGAIKAQCETLRKSYPNSPFVILSALAEGADRLIAKVAMKALEAELIAVLPMPPEEYERDFGTAESKQEFRALLNRAFCVRMAVVPEGDAWKVKGEPRNIQHARAGAMIADHAQVLFAIWDGEKARGTGGTADQLARFAREFSSKKYSLYENVVTALDPQEPGRVIRLDRAGANIVSADSPPAEQGERSKIEVILYRTNEFNSNVENNAEAISESCPLVDESSVRELALTNAVYQAADGVSMTFANTVRKIDARIYILAMLAVIVFNFVSVKAFAPWSYLLITGVMLGLALRVRAGSLDNRFLEYRCFSEALRTLFFWRAAGVTHPVWLSFLSRQLGAVHWIRQAVRTVEFCQDGLPCSHPVRGSGAETEGVLLAKKKWVDDQAGWFAKRQGEHYARYMFWRRLSRIAIAGSFLTATVIAALTLYTPPGASESLFSALVSNPAYADAWQLALSVCAAGAVAARGFLLRTAHLEIAKQYSSQRLIFEKASKLLDLIRIEPEPEWTSKQVLEKLGQEALQEQAEWVWLRHTRPFEVPAG